MEVYIEDAFIENFLVTLFLLLCVDQIFKTKTKKIKLFCSSALGGVFATLYPLVEINPIISIIFKLASGVLIIFLYEKKSKLAGKYFCFLFLTALYGGINILVYYTVYGTLDIQDNFATYILILILFVTYFLFSSCLKLMQKNFVISNFVYDVKITDGNIQFIDSAFLDSGNTLIDQETNSPIFIINFKLFSKLYKDIKIEDILIKNYKNLKDPKYIKSGFASGSGKILIFTVDNVEILSKNTKKSINNAKLGLVYSKFNKNFNCNMLLNINAFVWKNIVIKKSLK